MKEADLYWVIYKNLEAETISLAKQVAFASDQKKVYSMAIADLIVRCAIEIESLSKKLYESLGGNMRPTDSDGNERDLYFDTDCLSMLEKKYMLSKKEVILSSPFFSFDDSVICPLKKANRRGDSGSLWKRAYQALKHDRYASLKEYGNVWNLINVMGALYLLNLYFRDVVYPVANSADSFDARVDSDIFSVMVFDATINTAFSADISDNGSIIKDVDINIDCVTYVIKYTDEYLDEIRHAIEKDEEETKSRVIHSPEIAKYYMEHKGKDYTDMLQLVIDAVGAKGAGKYIPMNNFKKVLASRGREAILNKNKTIYPPITEPKD